MIATIKNWSEFQHYRDRAPSWVKMHLALLDDYTFQSMPIAAKALLPMLWLLAAANGATGEVNIDPAFLEWRLRWKAVDIKTGIDPLISNGFLVVDSEPGAGAERVDSLEKRKSRDRGDIGQQADRFAEFWAIYPSRPGSSKPNRKGCAAKWKARKLDAQADIILADVALRLVKDKTWLDGFVCNPEVYINQDRWLDGFGALQAAPARPAEGNSPRKAETAQTHLDAVDAWARNMRALGSMDEADIQAQVERVYAKYGPQVTK